MLRRNLYKDVASALDVFPAVALLGCRQVGKTTLAIEIQKSCSKPSLYLDLELPDDRAKLSDSQLYLEQNFGKLLILDEIQRMPDLFAIMRGVIDKRKRAGELSCQYLILGSASPDLLKQSSESLAGRIAYLELDPFSLIEVAAAGGPEDYIDKLWLRGGFPDSFLSTSDENSMAWRNNFVTTYLERDLPQLNPRLSPEKINNLWRMLAFDQGSVLNASRLSLGLGVSVGTVKHYLAVLSGLFLIRFLQPWSGNSTKRLVKAPKTYVRDSGLLHALAKLGTMDDLAGHSLCGLSWEGFVIEQLLQAPTKCSAAMFYRSQAGAEIDLVLDIPGKGTAAIEIKRTIAPQISKGFRLGCEDIKPACRFYVMPRGSAFPLDKETQAISLEELIAVL